MRRAVRKIVSKLDRLGGDAQDAGATVKLLAGRIIAVIVLQLGTLDLASAAGKMMLTMLTAVAEIERNLLVERIQSRPHRSIHLRGTARRCGPEIRTAVPTIPSGTCQPRGRTGVLRGWLTPPATGRTACRCLQRPWPPTTMSNNVSIAHRNLVALART